MQDPNEDTEWNDVLRAKGILPPKEKKVFEHKLIIEINIILMFCSLKKSI